MPPPVFTLADWQANVRKAAEQLEAGRKARKEREAKARAEVLTRYNANENLGPTANYADYSPGITVGPEAWHAAHPEGVPD
jgi:hypothetical protein